MRNIEDAVLQFMDAIKTSAEYREYVCQKERVKKFPQLKTELDEFRRRNFEMQTSKDTAFDKLEEFENEFSEFRENSMVSDFLAAELAFCRMMQDINCRVTEAIDFE